MDNTRDTCHFWDKKDEEECSSGGRWRFSSVPTKVSSSHCLFPERGAGEIEWPKCAGPEGHSLEPSTQGKSQGREGWAGMLSSCWRRRAVLELLGGDQGYHYTALLEQEQLWLLALDVQGLRDRLKRGQGLSRLWQRKPW